MKKSHLIALGVTAGLAAVGALGYAAWEHFEDRDEPPRSNREASAGALLALNDALGIALSHVPGEVVKVERDREHDVEVIEIKILANNGRVRELTLDARSGAVLEIEDD
jgi:uncharacterized membrane protein YkoI